MTEEHEKLIKDLKAEGLGNVTELDAGISCNLFVPDCCLPAFLKMVKALNKIER